MQFSFHSSSRLIPICQKWHLVLGLGAGLQMFPTGQVIEYILHLGELHPIVEVWHEKVALHSDLGLHVSFKNQVEAARPTLCFLSDIFIANHLPKTHMWVISWSCCWAAGMFRIKRMERLTIACQNHGFYETPRFFEENQVFFQIPLKTRFLKLDLQIQGF